MEGEPGTLTIREHETMWKETGFPTKSCPKVGRGCVQRGSQCAQGFPQPCILLRPDVTRLEMLPLTLILSMGFSAVLFKMQRTSLEEQNSSRVLEISCESRVTGDLCSAPVVPAPP